MGWRTFTPRALGFGLAALALYFTARMTGVSELYMLTVAALLLPAGAWLVVTWGQHRLLASRSVRPLRSHAGGGATVTIRVRNPGRIDTGVLLLEDQRPYQLGPPARFVVPSVPHDDGVSVRYELPLEHRGRYQIGPLQVKLSDPFGLAQVSSELSGASEVVVHPAVEELPAAGIGGELSSSSATRVRQLFTRGDEFYTTREYRAGDDLRKVHWRSSAHRGQLMIRQEERPWQARALLTVDLRGSVHRGPGQASMERAISAVASMALRLGRSGFEVGLMTDDGRTVRAPTGMDQVTPILDLLADVQPSRGTSLQPLAERLGRSAGEGLLLAVLAVPTAEEAATLARSRIGFSSAFALLVRPDSWLGLAAREVATADAHAAGSAALLEKAGWRTAMLYKDDRLEAPWRRLTAPLGRATQISRRPSR